MLTQREQTILDAVIRDYIESASPVSSKRILEIENLPFSSATIRTSLNQLEETGYLSHPHTSAGRIPTQKGYRFFVDNLLENAELTPGLAEQLEQIHELRELTRFIAAETHLFAIAAGRDGELFSNFGMREILVEPEFHNIEFMRRFGSLVDEIADHIDSYEHALDNSAFQVFIESENPIPEAKIASVVFARIGNNRGYVFALGPSRMNYEKTTRLFKSLDEIIDDHIYE
jgi:heat-inducible transcriptional repressor